MIIFGLLIVAAIASVLIVLQVVRRTTKPVNKAGTDMENAESKTLFMANSREETSTTNVDSSQNCQNADELPPPSSPLPWMLQ